MGLLLVLGVRGEIVALLRGVQECHLFLVNSSLQLMGPSLGPRGLSGDRPDRVHLDWAGQVCGHPVDCRIDHLACVIVILVVAQQAGQRVKVVVQVGCVDRLHQVRVHLRFLSGSGLRLTSTYSIGPRIYEVKGYLENFLFQVSFLNVEHDVVQA